LDGVDLTCGELVISPVQANTPPEAEKLKEAVYGLLPSTKITDVPLDVDSWTGFADCFTHQRNGRAADNKPALLSSILAEAAVAPRSQVNARHGNEPGVSFYTHISDQFGPFYTKVIAANTSEAAHVLDALSRHGTGDRRALYRHRQRLDRLHDYNVSQADTYKVSR
jgi:hypothetical protein